MSSSDKYVVYESVDRLLVKWYCLLTDKKKKSQYLKFFIPQCISGLKYRSVHKLSLKGEYNMLSAVSEKGLILNQELK